MTTPKELIDRALTEASISPKIVSQIAQMTDYNDHTGARKLIATSILKNKKMASAYEGLENLHQFFGHMPRELMNVRDVMLEQMLKKQLQQKLSPEDFDQVWGAL
jgi:hypothetical protein